MSRVRDDDGYIWYKGREDDLISSGGYRIGPTDIEDCLMKHRGRADGGGGRHARPGRAARSSAPLSCRSRGSRRGPALADEIRGFVGERLAWYQAPREIVFVDELPLTAPARSSAANLRGR